MLTTDFDNAVILQKTERLLSGYMEQHNYQWMDSRISFPLDKTTNVGMVGDEEAVADMCRAILYIHGQQSDDPSSLFAAAERLIRQGGVVLSDGRFNPGTLFLPYEPEGEPEPDRDA